MIFYAPAELYEEKLTVMEMICCSPCITSLLCFSMEVNYGHMLDSELHMQRHRVGARGNATSFVLPWEALLKEFKRSEDDATAKRVPLLPHVGQELADVVQVLFKANDYDAQVRMQDFIHQATVRRKVVVHHILAAKARRHRAYMNVNQDQVLKRAALLPEKGVPPEVCRYLSLDDSISKLQVQKAAAPVEGRSPDWNTQAAQEFAAQRPNAVVLERSSHGEIDTVEAQKTHFYLWCQI